MNFMTHLNSIFVFWDEFVLGILHCILTHAWALEMMGNWPITRPISLNNPICRWSPARTGGFKTIHICNTSTEAAA